MKQRDIPSHTKSHIELFPASELLQPRPWDTISLPEGAYLLVTTTKNERLLNLYRKITPAVRQRGREVFFWMPNFQVQAASIG